VTIVNPRGRITAPPTPWTIRAAISVATLVDRAAAAEPTANVASPATSMRRRPNRSPSAAPATSSAAKLTL
jgi:hypothetical protein